jgi:hypothetical protein
MPAQESRRFGASTAAAESLQISTPETQCEVGVAPFPWTGLGLILKR